MAGWQAQLVVLPYYHIKTSIQEEHYKYMATSSLGWSTGLELLHRQFSIS